MLPEYTPLESEEAQVFVQWLQLQGLRFTHVGNETGHTLEARRRAIRMKRQGTSPGFPDYVVLIPPHRSKDGQGYLLIIELKRRRGGTVSAEQRAWLAAFNALGLPSVEGVVAHGAEEAISYVLDHLKVLEQVF